MSRALPPLDLHAHIDPDVAPRELEALGAVVFAATRSLTEYTRTAVRSDAVTIWGLGCHPAVQDAQADYDETGFAAALNTTPFISEVGLDGTSAVLLARQVEVLGSILDLVVQTPRIVSIHSKRATTHTLAAVERAGMRGAILHWWLGSPAETARALSLGCLFSVNRGMDLAKLHKAGVPIESLLPETDHPSGNRRGSEPRQPGWTVDVERTIALTYGVSPEFVRQQSWRTLVKAIDNAEVDPLLPPVVRAMAGYVRSPAE